MGQRYVIVALVEELGQAWSDLYGITGVRNDIRKLDLLEKVRDCFVDFDIEPTEDIKAFYYRVYLTHEFLTGDKEG